MAQPTTRGVPESVQLDIEYVCSSTSWSRHQTEYSSWRASGICYKSCAFSPYLSSISRKMVRAVSTKTHKVLAWLWDDVYMVAGISSIPSILQYYTSPLIPMAAFIGHNNSPTERNFSHRWLFKGTSDATGSTDIECNCERHKPT